VRVAIKIGVPTWEIAPSWGDFHMARAIGRALLARGHDYTIHILPEWERKEAGIDATLHLMGRSAYRTRGDSINMIWIISHPDEALALNLSQYDLLFSASRRFAEKLQEDLGREVHYLPQATDPGLFYPDGGGLTPVDLLFAGNSRKIRRRILDDLLPCPWGLHIWGDMWDGLVDDRYVQGTYYPYERLRELYSSARLVLNDHWDDMRRWGFVSNRVFDALAAGACLISDPVEDLHSLVGDVVVTCGNREELHGEVGRLLANPEERARRGKEGRSVVLERHTIASRVDEILLRIEGISGDQSGTT